MKLQKFKLIFHQVFSGSTIPVSAPQIRFILDLSQLGARNKERGGGGGGGGGEGGGGAGGHSPSWKKA